MQLTIGVHGGSLIQCVLQALKGAGEYLAIKSLASTIANEMPETEEGTEPAVEEGISSGGVGEPGDPPALKQLLQMFYPRDKAMFFLDMCAGDVAIAMDYMREQGVAPTQQYIAPAPAPAKPKRPQREYVTVDVESAYRPDLAETDMTITVCWLRADDAVLDESHKTLSVDASSSDTIRDLKWRIKLATHGDVAVDRQRLFVDGADEPEPEDTQSEVLTRSISKTEVQLRDECAAAGIDGTGGKIVC